MNILVIGGAGYIGSYMVHYLASHGVSVTTLDDLSAGYHDAVLHGELVHGCLGDQALLTRLFKQRHFDLVMHFASFIQVGESTLQPAKYYRNNVSNTLVLLQAMHNAGINKFVFSSTAATFGEPQYSPIDERHPQWPINPYGWSKLMIERVLVDYAQAYGLKSRPCKMFETRMTSGVLHV